MTNEQAKAIFDTAIQNAQDPDQIAKLEVVREYLFNGQFRQALQDHLWETRNP